MHVIPVIDLQFRQVVHGRAGQRDQYRAVKSVLTSAPTPATLGQAFRQQLGLTSVYVADLDAIAGREPCWEAYRQLTQTGLNLLLDAGTSDEWAATRLMARLDCPIELVVGLETLSDLADLRRLLTVYSAERVVFSLDLQAGRPRTRIERWQAADPLRIVGEIADLGLTRLILLDLQRVGMGQGTGTSELLGGVRRQYPSWELICGGGIASLADLRRLNDQGCDAALLATTLHDGRIVRKDLAAAAAWPRPGDPAARTRAPGV